MDDVGRYRVTRRLGQGGMAEVFEGVALGEEGFQRRVAIKRMRAENAAEPAFGRMFLDEARIASQLHHASIVAVLDFGVADGYPFQVLEYVDGVDANRLAAMGREAGAPMPAAMALAICTDIAHALEHAHAAVDAEGRSLGIVHRDVSPANILVSWNGDVKLTDFGIAFARGRKETTSAGFTKGTLLYMAPEQIMHGAIDGRTDVFALGCVLQTLLVGASPLAGENAMADLIAGKPLRVSRDLPDDVYDIVVRATRLSKEDRFANAGEMAGALGKALARRIDQDARTMMREWMARLRPQAPPATAGKLDALLGANLVFSGLRKSLPPGDVQAPATPASDGTIDQPPRRRTGLLWVAVLAPMVGFAVAVVAWRNVRKEPFTSSTSTLADAAVVAVAVPVAVPVPDAAPVPVPAPAPAPVTVASRPRPPRDRPAPPPPVTPPPPLARTDASGVVAIGGTGALRAEILVDGASRGFAPRVLALPTGAHTVVLILPDGHRVSKTLTVQATHTPSSPLRWQVP